MEFLFEENYDVRDFDSLRDQFEVSELRSMSRSSVILRGLALRGISRIPFDTIEKHSIGIYLVGEEGGFSTLNVASVFKTGEKEDVDAFRKIPAKSLIGLPTSMTAAQIEMASAACGPVICVDLTPSAIEFILDEIQLDLATGRVKAFFLGAIRDSVNEAAWLVFANRWGHDLRVHLKQQLERIVHVSRS